ncbi:DUF3592 domain-containing protein [Oscillatoria laete-virens NRMC-F 0139]|nr:DUF3592 domain-containing protein [Oscillatoria laete-virens NRMC-F 0139]
MTEPGHSRHHQSMIHYALPIPFVLVGIILCAWGYREYRKTSASLAWPQTQGVVISNRVENQQYVDKNVRYRHWAEIHIRYEWEGRVHDTGKPALSSRAYELPYWAKKEAAKFPVGQQVTVHVNPADPSQAVVHAGATPASKLLIVIGLILPVIGVIASLITARFLRI